MKYTSKLDTLSWWYYIPVELFDFAVATDEGYYLGNHHATVLTCGHFTCALASFGSMILRWISPALKAYGKHFKWGVNKENTVDEFYSIALDGGGFIW